MEALLLAAQLYANKVPNCPQPFVKAMRANEYVEPSKSPRRPCKYEANGGFVFYKGRGK